jgi:hypothetical protein
MTSVLNTSTGTALVGMAAFMAAAWLALGRHEASNARAKDGHRLNWDAVAMAAFLFAAMTAIMLAANEVLFSWQTEMRHTAFLTADFFSALLGLAAMAVVAAMSVRATERRATEGFWTNCTALATIAFNLIAVLTGVREVSAVWNASPSALSKAEDALQQALAVSAFLMVYGAALLAVGFWRRSALLRWQALALLVFTISKTFVYDMRSLSQGYRVASVLGLGVLLMAISFAYQKDWLNLRVSEAEDAAAGAADEGESASSEAIR